MCRVVLLLVTVFALWSAPSPAAAQENERPVRLAVIVAGGESAPPPAVEAQLLAALSAQGSIHVLERERVHELLAEQRLSLSAGSDAETLVAAGRLLAADLLAFLDAASPEG